MAENREIPRLPAQVGRTEKADGRKTVMHEGGKSDRPVVPGNPSNKAARPAAETGEGRGLAKGNLSRDARGRTQRRDEPLNSGLARVREIARRDKGVRFTALLHHVTLERLTSAYQALEPKAAPGVDGVWWADYGRELEGNLRSLLKRIHQGGYHPKAVRRKHITKSDGGKRPLGIATVEDKVLQRALAEVMNAIYEADFRGFSYGFRPGRGAHDALDALATVICKKKVSWVLDADIKSYFDTIDHELLMRCVERRIGDKRILHLIRSWLRAGVMEDGIWSPSKEGTPQGATISPLLANIFLHYVLDDWTDEWRRRHARDELYIVRYADDFTVCAVRREDAERYLTDLRDRLARFRLTLHPDKTRLIEFGPYAAASRQRRGEGRPEVFDFLGFTHICARNQSGGFLLKRRTGRKRARTKLAGIRDQLRKRMHDPLPTQGVWLRSVLGGYFQYFAVPTNLATLRQFRTQVTRLWQRALSRRSQKGYVPWEKMKPRVERWLPKVRQLHPWPDDRFSRRHRVGT